MAAVNEGNGAGDFTAVGRVPTQDRKIDYENKTQRQKI